MIQFDEPAFNVYMSEVNEWGIRKLTRAAEGADLPDRCSHLLWLRHQGEHGLEGNARRSEWRQYEQIFPAIEASPHSAGRYRVP